MAVPIIELWEGVLLVPLAGDHERARDDYERALAIDPKLDEREDPDAPAK